MHKVFISAIIVAYVFSAGPVHAETVSNVGFAPQGVLFSKDPFFAGDNVTVFAFLVNCQDEEIRGDIVFLDNEDTIAERTFALKGSCATATVSAPWEVSEGGHTVTARITRAVFADTQEEVAIEHNALGEVTRTAMRDTDEDGIPDKEDPDDDNDGLSDEEERELKTNPALADTDGDGILDDVDPKPRHASTSTPQKLAESVKNTTATLGPTASSTKRLAQNGFDKMEEFRKEQAQNVDSLDATLAKKREAHASTTNAQAGESDVAEKIQGALLAGAHYASKGLSLILNTRILFYALLALLIFWLGRKVFRRLRALVRGRPADEY